MTDPSPAQSGDASDALPRIRAFAMLLPEVEERSEDGQPTFFVAGTPFAQVRKGDDRIRPIVSVRGSNDDTGAADWLALSLANDADWALIEDRIARSWELAAPDRLLEAGGR
jgi:hypothetical protein